jgi:hypothetical protein
LMDLRPVRHYFCQIVDCPVVYFSQDGEQSFAEAQLRERVYQKHPHEDESTICYCFQHTLGSIRAQWRESGESTVVAAITRGTQSGQCACDIRNPQGNCCLGNVKAFVKQIKETKG